MRKNGVQHHADALVITIPTNVPAATHAQLLQSLAANLAHGICNTEKGPQFADELLPSVELLRIMLPDELQLRKAFE